MRFILTMLVLITVFAHSPAHARDQINIVGSSTVFPFVAAAAERFGKTTDYPTPFVEQNGTGIGMKMFCDGIGGHTPDFVNASRHIKDSEIKQCNENGIYNIKEIELGADGIIFGNSKESTRYNFSTRAIFLALAAQVPGDGKLVDNPYVKWSEIDTSLPDAPIEVYGPKSSSGTRDAFVELVMEAGCKQFPEYEATYPDKKNRKLACHMIRKDTGRYLEVGEQDNVTIKKLSGNPSAFGIFGFSYYDQNSHLIQGNLIDGVVPTFETIASREYPVARTLFVYAKMEHADLTPGMRAFIEEITGETALNPFDGYLPPKGLIPLPEEKREAQRRALTEPQDISMMQ